MPVFCDCPPSPATATLGHSAVSPCKKIILAGLVQYLYSLMEDERGSWDPHLSIWSLLTMYCMKLCPNLTWPSGGALIGWEDKGSVAPIYVTVGKPPSCWVKTFRTFGGGAPTPRNPSPMLCKKVQQTHSFPRGNFSGIMPRFAVGTLEGGGDIVYVPPREEFWRKCTPNIILECIEFYYVIL